MTIYRSSPLRIATGGMVGMAVAMGIGRFVYTPILPGMMRELGLSASDAGLIASANYLGYLLGAFAAAGGWAQGRERSVTLWSIAASALLAGAMGCVSGIYAFLVIRFAAGVASAFVMVFLSAIVLGRLASLGRGDLQALHFGGVGVGIAISSLMTGALHEAGSGWATSWIWAAILSLVGFAVTAMLVRESPSVSGRHMREPKLPRGAALVKLILLYGIFGFGYVITATFLVAIVRQGHGGQLFESAVWLVTGLTGLPSLFVWNRVVRRVGHMPAIVLGCIVEAVGVVASIGFGGRLGPLLCAVLFGGTFIAVTAIGLQVGRILAPAAPSRVLALMTVSFGIGQILGPIVSGVLADRTGSFAVPSLVAALALLVVAAIASSVRRSALTA